MWPLKTSLCTIILVAFFSVIRGLELPNTTLVIDAPLKISLVEEIVHKICNISLETFANKSPEEKSKLVKQLEEKLNKSAQALGDHGAKYVKLIMKGIKAKAFHPELSIEKRISQTGIHSKLGKSKINSDVSRSSSIHDSKSGLRSIPNHKGELISNIAKKVEMLADAYVKEFKSPQQRLLAIKKIKELLINSANHTGTIKQEYLDKYVDLVVRGVEIMMNNAESRRAMKVDFTHTENLGKSSRAKEKLLESAETDLTLNNELGHKSNAEKQYFKIGNPDKNIKPVCNDTLEHICQKIKLLKSRKCSSSNANFNILKLCDGKNDCQDSSDEKDCAIQATETIHAADNLISYIDASLENKCYPDLADRSLLSKQNKVLSVVLKQQLTALGKSAVDTPSVNVRRFNDVRPGSIKEAVHEAMYVVDSLTSALGTSMCKGFDERGSRVSELLTSEKKHYENDEENVQFHPNPEICKCNGSSCAKTCTARCGDICSEMYSLGQLTCQTVSGEEFLSLDVICDGKLDCVDENDEKDCSIDASLAKFEATNMYNYILKDIEAKMITTTYNVLSKLQSLHALVTSYEKISLQRNVNISEVKRSRDAMFEGLKAVYDTAVRHINSHADLFDMRFSLSTMKERLISALKRSNTGNERIMTSDGCLCRGYDCMLPKCSKTCIRACSAEPQLTRFFCGKLKDPLNNTVPLELLCNGKANCPNGEDEKGCKTGACRSLHLKQLAKKLQDCGRDGKGAALLEALRLWRIKAQATLAVAGEDSRPTRPVLHEILRGLLRDLVHAYSLLEGKKDESVLQEFTKWSRIVMDTLKSCNA